MITQEQFDDAVLALTGDPNWDIITQGLANDIYQTQASVFDSAHDWGQVMELKGFARGLAYVVNLRNNVVLTLKTEAANAKL